MSDFPVSILAPVIGLLGVCLGGIIGYRTSLRVAKAVAKREARSNLRTAFASCLASVRVGQSNSATEIRRLLEASVDLHTLEMEKFRFYVNHDSLSAYDQVCEKYKAAVRLRVEEANAGNYPYKHYEAKIMAVLSFA